MAELLIKDVPESLISSLAQRASEHGVSVEEEHRRILEGSLCATNSGLNGAFVEHLLSPDGQVDTFPLGDRRPSDARKVEL